jgi:signal transduction histidine kinase
MQVNRNSITNDTGPLASEPRWQTITPERVEAYMQRGRRLRSVYAWWTLRRLRRRVRDLFNPPRRAPVREADGDATDALDNLAGELRTPLTSIRSSVEILRNHPDIKTNERARFLDIVLAEEARLESIVTRIMAASEVNDRADVWRVRLNEGRLPER